MSDIGDKERQLQAARDYWRRRQGLAAGRLVFENLPNNARPEWAARILRVALQKSAIRSGPIDRVLRIADNAGLWSTAHSAFEKVRAATLKLDAITARNPQQELLLHHLCLAENVAKVVYNSTDPSDSFDDDTGWWIVECLLGLVDWWNDDDFAARAYSAVFGGD
jgi:hypothetical protein